MHQIKQKLAAELSETLDTEVEEEDIEMPEGEYGDFAYPVMKVAGKKGGNPRELAEKTAGELENIEIVENKPLARALNQTAEIGEEIPADLYQAVAEVLAFIMRGQF